MCSYIWTISGFKVWGFGLEGFWFGALVCCGVRLCLPFFVNLQEGCLLAYGRGLREFYYEGRGPETLEPAP